MKIPGGGLLSTAPDLVRFGLAMLGDKLVSAETRAAMWQRQPTKDGKATRYGLGFAHWKLPSGSFLGHTGGQAGTTCALVLHPPTGVVVAVMSNLQQAGPLNRLAARIARRSGG
jgi:CubicO group peptidase (beta-lactamase class C family)